MWWSFDSLARALSVHLAKLAEDESAKSLVVRGVPRLDESVVICILRREVPRDSREFAGMSFREEPPLRRPAPKLPVTAPVVLRAGFVLLRLDSDIR